jgi:NAD(P)-dependent dehydrogenase (short-subunit alcohol dehydrogenase family)
LRAIDNKDAAIITASIAAGVAASLVLFRRDGLRLEGRVVLITGGSRGLGLSLAREFASDGCRVAICARDSAELDAARQDLEGRGANVLAVECDVSDREQVGRMVERVLGHFGRVDILVNNAGEIQVGPVESMTLDDFERAMRVMFWGTVYPSMALLPHLKQRQGTRIVNITSIGGKVAVPHLLPYTCAKFAAVGFSEGLRAELAGAGVKVVTVAPGLMRTGSYLNASFKGDQDREAAWFSIGATMPGVSMNATRAARQIVEAARRGSAEKILSTPASLMARFHGLFPGLTSNILGLADRVLLPSGAGQNASKGKDTRALNSPLLSALTILGKIAARRFLETPERRPATI